MHRQSQLGTLCRSCTHRTVRTPLLFPGRHTLSTDTCPKARKCPLKKNFPLTCHMTLPRLLLQKREQKRKINFVCWMARTAGKYGCFANLPKKALSRDEETVTEALARCAGAFMMQARLESKDQISLNRYVIAKVKAFKGVFSCSLSLSLSFLTLAGSPTLLTFKGTSGVCVEGEQN